MKTWAISLVAGLLFGVVSPVQAAEYKPGDSIWDCSTCPEMIVVPAGSFTMGADSRYKYERPAHKVTIPKPFAIGRFEITFDQWLACVDEGGCAKDPDDHKWGKGIHPIMNISWAEANGYTEWLSKKTGHTYRLPSEAEWEYAARGGTTTAYSWGDAPGKDRANCRNCGDEIPHRTFPVGSFEPNPFGLYDVHGNVWEWTADCWNATHKDAPGDGSTRLAGNCMMRVTRSGSWYYVNTNLRSAYRSKYPAKAFSYGIGMRILRELP
ncbi:MAG: formylglycine-generating enzyme family protein [Rhodospirillales bacterium]|nr:formylglycine-generating enzyme family protein [Rhodospirillales bacterium]